MEKQNEHWCKKLADFYINHSLLIGALYGIVPAVLWFGTMFCLIPIRNVYFLRFVLVLFFAGISGACLNRYGLNFWLLKHRSPQGPANIIDGMFIGAAIGFGTAFLSPLTALIGTNHLELAKWFIICAWIFAVLTGFFWGGLITAIAGKHITREL